MDCHAPQTESVNVVTVTKSNADNPKRGKQKKQTAGGGDAKALANEKNRERNLRRR
jgi:hypothetical protein